MKSSFAIASLAPAWIIACGMLASTAIAQDLVHDANHQVNQFLAFPFVIIKGFEQHVGVGMFEIMSRIFALGYTCVTNDVEYHFDYVDSTDSSADCTPDPTLQTGYNHSSVSGGGRWHLRLREDSPGENPRKIRISFTAPALDADCDRLESTLTDMGLNCGCSQPCDLNVWINADSLFKNNATREGLSRFDIVEAGGIDGSDGPDLKIQYWDHLYLCDAAGHEGDPDWRVLKSAPCNSMDLEAGALADVGIPPDGRAGQDDILGQWLSPLHITAHCVPDAALAMLRGAQALGLFRQSAETGYLQT